MRVLPGSAFLLTLIIAGAGDRMAMAQPPRPAAPLDRLQPGLWELKNVGDRDAPPSRICVSDLRQLLQPSHPVPVCRQFVTGTGADEVTVTYDCAARGQGHSRLRVETPRLVQIDSQGIEQGRPFSTRLEGRFVGRCTGKEIPPPGH